MKLQGARVAFAEDPIEDRLHVVTDERQRRAAPHVPRSEHHDAGMLLGCKNDRVWMTTPWRF